MTRNTDTRGLLRSPGGATRAAWYGKLLFFCLLLLVLIGVATSCGQGSQPVTPPQNPPPPPTGGGNDTGSITVIEHVIFTLQENRSYDHYFGRLAEYQRQHGITPQMDEIPLDVQLTDKAGHWVKPFHQRTVCHEGITPAWGASHVDYNDGKMDKFLHTVNNSDIDVSGTRAIGYYDWTDLPYYYDVATKFATSDRFFSSLLARTPPNRMYMVGASSYGNIDSGTVPADAPTIFDRLQDKGISWKYYYLPGVQGRLSTWSIASKHPENIQPIDKYFEDLNNSTLPAVAFIERGVGLDEHPTDNIQKGAADMKTEIDALMKSESWKNTVFFLTFDEGGGLYDHVPPITVPAPDDIPPKLGANEKPGDFTLSGFRVPLMVISPWVKPGFVSHVGRELTSILKFIEVRWGLDPLTKRDAWADDMTEMFDFSNASLMTPPDLAEQPVNGRCDYQVEMSPDHAPGVP